jgi:cell wall-associated NlpC family hydrolase
MDREFIAGTQDCLSFIADWLYQNKGIELPRCPHDEYWFVKGHDYMQELYEAWGFVPINTVEPEIGDLVMFKIRSPVINHLGIYIGNGQIAHHLTNRMPTIELMGKWKGYIDRIARYKK